VATLLRQLSAGLSAYRLFPGDLDQPGFAMAARRIHMAADRVLAVGPLDAEVKSDTFIVAEGPVAPDEGVARLAHACYQRRIEVMRVRSVPSIDELGSLYEVLSAPVDQVLAGGGADLLLRRAGVMSVALSELNPQAIRSQGLEETAPEPLDLPELSDELTLPPEDVEALRESPLDFAESLFGRFQAVVAALPQEIGSNLELYRMLRASVAALPEEQRRMLQAVLLDRALDDPLAERYIGTMNDTELARLVVDVAQRFERDPLEMADRLVRMRLRGEDLIELTSAVVEGRMESGTLLAGEDEVAISAAMASSRLRVEERAQGADVQAEDASDLMFETVGDLLSQSLLAREQQDVLSLRDQFPSTDQAQRLAATEAIRDYLLVDDDLERLERVLAAWMETAREGLREGDVRVVRDALDLLEGPRAASAAEPDRAKLFDLYRSQLPEPGILETLVERAKDPGGHDRVEELLGPLEEVSVTALLELLETDQESHERAIIISLATDLARDHLDTVTARIGDRRASVARDAVTVAYRVGGTSVLSTLDQASRHAVPDVREEAVRGLIAVAGASAAGRLRELARDPEPRVQSLAVAGLGGLIGSEAIGALIDVAISPGELVTRREAIDQLARHPSPEARARLTQVARGKTTPRAHRQLRRYAKGALRS
jgi:hypothetical protein